ncbi:Co2 transporter [Caenispirillum salinarum AK4]|uniref:Co2 transporter n=1 Tax=Caenispirillum salinarum AK4 TaxID=1238182 RepID=K9HDS4_9PROT|nr:HlyC/CorC family transporter [Caenispirillum salinarum]EKV26901.1 Co2 transporter [Caenispirillum salinarum AK4]
MTTAMIVSIVAILVCLVLSAFFSGSETALTAASRPLISELERKGDTRAGIANGLLIKRERLIATILLGNNLVNILASALATSVLIGLFGEGGVAMATVVMTIMILIFSEILPKTYALTHTHRMALGVAPIMRVLVTIFQPLTSVIQGMVSVTLKVVGGGERPHTSSMALAELRGAIEMHTAQAAEAGGEKVIAHERAMLRSVLDLADVEVSEIMVPRGKLVTIDADQPTSDIVRQVLASPYTRIPLWRGKSDNIVGILHAKALLRAVEAHSGDISDLDIVAIASPPWFIPDATRLLDQLQAFRQRREHFALVVDEYGVLLGIVTLEDILEEIVGEISDEHDIAVSGVRPQPDGSFVIDGGVTIRDLNRQFEWDLPDEEAATIAGLVLHESRSIPDPGQTFLFHGFRFEVLRRHRNQITSIRVTPVAEEEKHDEDTAQPSG